MFLYFSIIPTISRLILYQLYIIQIMTRLGIFVPLLVNSDQKNYRVKLFRFWKTLISQFAKIPNPPTGTKGENTLKACLPQ